MRYENEIEFDGVAYMLMCEIELVEREHKAVSMMCGIEDVYKRQQVKEVTSKVPYSSLREFLLTGETWAVK